MGEESVWAEEKLRLTKAFYAPGRNDVDGSRGSRRQISFTTRASRVGSEGMTGASGVAANLFHLPDKLAGVL